MEAVVTAAFIDRRSGKRIRVGDPLPPDMAEDRLRKLERAGCVRIVGSAPPPAAEEKPKRKRRSPAAGSGESQTSFLGQPPVDPAPLAGADGGDPGAGPIVDADGCADGDVEGTDDSGR